MMLYRPIRAGGLPKSSPSDPSDMLLYSPTSSGDRVHTSTMLEVRNFLLGPPLRGVFTASSSTPVVITTSGTPVLVDTIAWNAVGSPQRLDVGEDTWSVVVTSDSMGVTDAFIFVEAMVSDSGPSTSVVSLYINGAEVMSSPPVDLGGGHSKRLCLVSWLGEIHPNDVIDLYVTNTTSTSNITVHTARMTVMKPCP